MSDNGLLLKIMCNVNKATQQKNGSKCMAVVPNISVGDHKRSNQQYFRIIMGQLGPGPKAIPNTHWLWLEMLLEYCL